MENLTAEPGWNDVPQLEKSTIAIGGPDGSMNAQAKALAARTELLRNDLRKLSSTAGAAAVGTSDGRSVQDRLDHLPEEVDAAGTAAQHVTQHNDDDSAHPHMSAFITAEANRAELAASRTEDLKNQAFAEAGVFTTIAAGLAATPDGKWFRVAQGEGSDLAFIHYINTGGTAVVIAIEPSLQYITSRLLPDTFSKSWYPLFVDEAGNVPLWLNNGKLCAAALDDAMRDVVDTSYSKKIPLFVDEAGNVPVWLNDGKLCAVALDDSLLPSPQTGGMTDVEFDKKILQKVINTNGRTLWQYRAKQAKLDLQIASKIKIGFTGDSWTEHKTISQVFADYFYQKYGKAGDGWIQLNIDNVNLLNGLVLTRTGWTVYDASTGATPVFPTSMDGQYIYASTTTPTLTLSNLFATAIKIFYYDGDGVFRYAINGGAQTTVICTGTNKIVSKDITGLTLSAASTLAIDLVGNTGTVVIYGFYAEGSGNGVEIDKMGNGGITAPQYIKTLSYLPQTASVVAPDVLVMIISTNDFRTSVDLASFRDGLTQWVQAWKAAIPDSGIILVTPSQCNASGASPLSAFRDVMREVANEQGVEFFSLYDVMDTTYSKSNAQGLWADNLHLNSTGARFLFNQLNTKFLG